MQSKLMEIVSSSHCKENCIPYPSQFSDDVTFVCWPRSESYLAKFPLFQGTSPVIFI